MDETRKTNGDSIWTFLAGTAGSLALVGSLYSFWMIRSENKGTRLDFNVSNAALPEVTLPEIDFARQQEMIGKDVRRASKAVSRGLSTGLQALWDVAVGGADAVRTRARVVPTLVGSATEAGASLGSAVGRAGSTVGSSITHAGSTVGSTVTHTGASVGHATVEAGKATKSFVGATARAAMWLTLLGSALIYIYMPDPAKRDRFFARVRGYYDSALGTVQSARGGRNYAT